MVDKNLGVPLYEQVASELRKEILCGNYGEHGCIGTHTQLAQRFSVSLITVRKAVQLLEQEGMVDIQQGKGTFVRRANLVDPLHNLTGISNIMSAFHVQSINAVPVLRVRKTPDWLPRDVQRELGASCLEVVRVTSLQGTPFANTEMYLPMQYASGFEKGDVEQRTVYQIYQNKLGVTLGKGKQVIRAAGAHGRTAENLKIPENWPVLQIERKAYDSQENLIEYMILSYEASRYSFEVELQLDANGKQ